jgi:hypothetical protein
MKKLRIALTALMLVALLAMALPVVSLAQDDGNPNEDCPPGTYLVAKFEWTSTGYVFEKPPGNEGVIEIDGDETGGTWESTAGGIIAYVILKGGPGTYIYPDDGLFGPYDPPEDSGDFSKEDLPEVGTGNRPDISNIQFCAISTAVTGPGSSFNAEASAGRRVALTWETDTELDNAGFNLYRALLKDGPYTQINEALIAAEGDAVGGASYSFLDRPDYGTFYYKLEDVNLYGVSTLHGPVKVTLARRPLRSPLYRPRLPR